MMQKISKIIGLTPRWVPVHNFELKVGDLYWIRVKDTKKITIAYYDIFETGEREEQSIPLFDSLDGFFDTEEVDYIIPVKKPNFKQ
jgi:hypothetical protein